MKNMIKSNSRSVAGSFKREFYIKSKNKEIFENCDLYLAIGDEAMNELKEISHREARMLERGTGKLRKCCVCGDIRVNEQARERQFGTWLNKYGFKCFFCRFEKKKPRTKKFKRKQEIMKNVWELYLEKKFIGVKRIFKTKV